MKEKEAILVRFGQNLRRIRLKEQLSQEQLGFISDLDRTYISGVELGKRNISLINIHKLAKALEVDITELFGTTGEQDDESSL